MTYDTTNQQGSWKVPLKFFFQTWNRKFVFSIAAVIENENDYILYDKI